jgi:hypothetical protein
MAMEGTRVLQSVRLVHGDRTVRKVATARTAPHVILLVANVFVLMALPVIDVKILAKTGLGGRTVRQRVSAKTAARVITSTASALVQSAFLADIAINAVIRKTQRKDAHLTVDA